EGGRQEVDELSDTLAALDCITQPLGVHASAGAPVDSQDVYVFGIEVSINNEGIEVSSDGVSVTVDGDDGATGRGE
ncbi:hypothetical protein P5E54_15930, partial [Clostridium perfringens]|nr:hypothetical protein [Clostridium perfringens]